MGMQMRAAGFRAAIAVAGLTLLAGGAAVFAAPGATVSDPVLSSKLGVEQQLVNQRAQAPNDKAARNPSAARPPAAAPEAWASGIFDESDAPFAAARYTIANRWQEDFGGHHVVIYAGSLGTDGGQGVLVVMVYSMDSSTVVSKEFIWPKHQGGLRIASANGRLLKVISAAGPALTFNADTDLFAQ